MTRPAAPARLYIRTGKRVTAFYYKHADNTNEVLATAPSARKDKVKAAHELALRIWAERRGQPFTPFALRDCRPGGITEKMQNQEQDVFEGTGHADRRMIDQVYDRRRARGATAAR